MSSFSGYIVASPSGRDIGPRDLAVSEPAFAGGPTLRLHGNAFGIRRWEEHILTSPRPLADEPESDGGAYEYRMHVIRGRARMLFLAPRRRIVDFALGQILDRRIVPNLRKVSVFVDRLIDRCSEAESPFLITSLHGRFSGPSTQIRSLSLYGDDVTESTIYGEHGNLFNFHSCGVGRRLFEGLPRLKPNEEGEIVRVSTDGFVNVNLATRAKALEVIDVIAFILKNRWVEDWVPGEKGEQSWTT